MKRLCLPGLLITLVILSCNLRPIVANPSSILLASFIENDVTVEIHMAPPRDQGSVLSATFTPADGFHLYSKDIPPDGIHGLGRPTLLELSADSQLEVQAELIESVQAEVPSFEPRELLVYPAGPVTLRLEVKLPVGIESFDDSINVTYMACSDHLCKPPVVGKIVPIRIPAADAFNTP
jgi:hypothetical protein